MKAEEVKQIKGEANLGSHLQMDRKKEFTGAGNSMQFLVCSQIFATDSISETFYSTLSQID